jgi:hypothetical protein
VPCGGQSHGADTGLLDAFSDKRTAKPPSPPSDVEVSSTASDDISSVLLQVPSITPAELQKPRQHPEPHNATDGCAAEIPLDKKQIAEGTKRPPIYSDRVAVSPLFRGDISHPPLSPYTAFRDSTKGGRLSQWLRTGKRQPPDNPGPAGQAGSRGISGLAGEEGDKVGYRTGPFELSQLTNVPERSELR